MIQFDTTNLHNIEEKHGLSNEVIESKASLLSGYLEKIHNRDQGFYNVINDEATVKKIEDFAKKVMGEYDDIVVLGIGGSSLGTICLQQSLKHLFENEISDRTHPRLRVMDNIDPLWLKQLDDVIDYSRTLFVVVSKSGGTPETLAQYYYFRTKIDSKNLPADKHFVFITGPERGVLRRISNEENITAFEVPENVGGRFSVLTSVGLLPAALHGIDIRKLLSGAKVMRDLFLSENFADNFPFKLATIQYLLNKKNKVMSVIMPYSQRLIRFADWYRQLLAESIGKGQNENGETVNVGLTPIKALGVTDQHSQSQLYNEGPNDKFFIFINVNNLGPNVQIPNVNLDEPAAKFLNNLTFNKLMHTEQQGTIQSLTKNNRPNITISINEVNEENLGALFMLFEGSIAFLGEFYEINAFDQPGVELSKKITKELLS